MSGGRGGSGPGFQKARHGDVGEAVELLAELLKLGIGELSRCFSQQLSALSKGNHIRN